jgi:hypothetical protein
VSSTTESVLNINPLAGEPIVSPPSETIPTKPRRERNVGQLGYKELRDRVRLLGGDNTHLAGRNQFLEERHAEDRDSIEGLTRKLLSYDKAESELRQAAADHVNQSLARFDARSNSARQRFSDFDQTVQSNPNLRQDLLRAVVDMTSGPTVLYFLIKAPDFCKQLQNLALGAALEQIFIFVQQTEKNLLSSNITQTYLQLAKPAKEKHAQS